MSLEKDSSNISENENLKTNTTSSSEPLFEDLNDDQDQIEQLELLPETKPKKSKKKWGYCALFCVICWAVLILLLVILVPRGITGVKESGYFRDAYLSHNEMKVNFSITIEERLHNKNFFNLKIENPSVMMYHDDIGFGSIKFKEQHPILFSRKEDLYELTAIINPASEDVYGGIVSEFEEKGYFTVTVRGYVNGKSSIWTTKIKIETTQKITPKEI
ncbi:transmembrane protein 106b [Anaeramoeba flamelloides]|uniref:Transmembrane protein 106b n=1 Tax=Anaeramoeba flamelloides TaxID=1746091 RepID=A0AAV7YXB9_9EUKA|nr:transmembrane protein 106b [Anaeramoeba flamelloides]